MPLTDSSEGFSGLQQWSQPLIFDRLFAVYRKLLNDDARAHALTRLHARVWRALIAGDMAGFEALREALVSALGHANLTLNHLAEVDGEIMVELLDVVVSRYNRSHRTAMAYHLALMELVRRLRPAHTAAHEASELLPEPLAAQLPVERPRPAPVEPAFQRRREVVKRQAGDVGQVQLARFR